MLGALALSLLLPACSDEAPPSEVGEFPPLDTKSVEGDAHAPHDKPFGGVIGNTISESVADWPDPVRAPEGAPNILLIMLDDVGFAQLGSYGAHRIQTPHIDRLAEGGLRYNNFHATPLCSPTRAAFLTGRNHHSVAMGVIAELSTGFPGYTARMPLSHGMLSEVLAPSG
jgi:arylsulfatase